MNYTLSQLELFCAVVENQSITVAADRLNLTQPAVSIQLKNFQKQFSEPLYEIIQQRFHVTDYGREIYEGAILILEQVDQFNRKLRWPKDTLVGKIKFSVVSTGKYIAPYIMARFVEKEPGVSWHLDVSNKAQVLQSLEKNQVDITLMSILPTDLEIEYVSLMPNQLFLVGSKNPPHGINLNSKTLEWSAMNSDIMSGETINNNQTIQGTSYSSPQPYPPQILESLPLIFRESGSGTRTMMEAFIAKNQLKVNVPFELATNEAVKQAVLAGLGYSIMPLIGIKHELDRGELQIIDVAGLPMQTSWYIVWLKSKKLSPAARAFLDFIRLHPPNTTGHHII